MVNRTASAVPTAAELYCVPTPITLPSVCVARSLMLALLPRSTTVAPFCPNDVSRSPGAADATPTHDRAPASTAKPAAVRVRQSRFNIPIPFFENVLRPVAHARS